jgi:REP element-mobilizing transposase RayT
MADQEENTTNNNAAEEAKQSRQQPNDNKKNVHVRYTGKYYIVQNDGDDAVLYESEQKEASLDFAQKVADEHNVEVVLDGRMGEDEDKSDRPGGEERKDHSERRRHEERKDDAEGPRNVLIEDDGKYYIVRNDGDRAKLYESEDKEASLDFARKVAKDHQVDLVMIDRDGYIILEERYNGNGEARDKRENGRDKDKGK